MSGRLGIEPTSTAWKAVIIATIRRPLNFRASRFELELNPPKGLVLPLTLCPDKDFYIILFLFGQFNVIFYLNESEKISCNRFQFGYTQSFSRPSSF